MYQSPPASIVVAVIAFIVSVPVLSLLMTVVPPSVSTSVSDLTTALASARRCAPDDSIVWTNVGRPVGIAAIAVETHSSTRVVVSWPRTMPKMAITATAAQASMPNTLVMLSSSRCSGDRERLVAVTMSAMLAHLGRLAGGGHHERRRAAGDLRVLEHQVGAVAEGGLALGERRRGPWRSGALSPVSAASCTSSVAEVTIRPSAGTTSPASSSTMSPGTSPVDSTSSTWPDRRTRALGTWSWANASTLARALSSWFVPMTTLNVTSASTTMAVANCPMAKLAPHTISSMMFIGLAS